MASRIQRLLPSQEAHDLLALTRDLADSELAPSVDAAERAGEFPREALHALGKAGLLSLPYDPAHGGGGQPYEVYLQVLEEISYAWLSVGISVSVHSLACFPLAHYGTDEQRGSWLPDMLAGDLLGAYCLSEPQSGSDAAALQTRATQDGDGYLVSGTKAWITHGGVADFYNVMARTSDDGARGITCLLVPADAPGMSFASPEHKMGANASPTAQVIMDRVRVPTARTIGTPGKGFSIALAALDAGRLGIAACAVGLAQAALDAAADYARTREQFGKSIGSFQGMQFLLADMAAAVQSSRATYLDAARRKDAGLPFGIEAATAKLVATDAAMRVTTDAVQVLGGNGYTTDYPLERYMREAKVLQIVEGTNQIQRMVIGRSLTGGA